MDGDVARELAPAAAKVGAGRAWLRDVQALEGAHEVVAHVARARVAALAAVARVGLARALVLVAALCVGLAWHVLALVPPARPALADALLVVARQLLADGEVLEVVAALQIVPSAGRAWAVRLGGTDGVVLVLRHRHARRVIHVALHAYARSPPGHPRAQHAKPPAVAGGRTVSKRPW